MLDVCSFYIGKLSGDGDRGEKKKDKKKKERKKETQTESKGLRKDIS